MSVYETFQLLFSFATLIILILKFWDKK
ncbi:MAG: putative holin-like toxin [Clostridiales bacterium]|nr:putative holin-like toxin [Clostridiales bacterium]